MKKGKRKKKRRNKRIVPTQNTYLPPNRLPITEKLFPNIRLVIQERVYDKKQVLGRA